MHPSMGTAGISTTYDNHQRHPAAGTRAAAIHRRPDLSRGRPKPPQPAAFTASREETRHGRATGRSSGRFATTAKGWVGAGALEEVDLGEEATPHRAVAGDGGNERRRTQPAELPPGRRRAAAGAAGGSGHGTRELGRVTEAPPRRIHQGRGELRRARPPDVQQPPAQPP